MIFRQKNFSSSVTVDLGKWVIESMNLKQFSRENEAKTFRLKHFKRRVFC